MPDGFNLDPSQLKAALDAALADGYAGGSLAAVQQLPTGADPGVAALFGPNPSTAWSEWKPGNVDAAALLDNGGFKDLLDSSQVTIKSITDTTLERMGNVLAEEAAAGSSVDQISDKLYDLLGDSSRADMIANTELARATSAASLDTYSTNGVKRWEWLLSPDACPRCQDMADEGLHTLDQEPPPLHPNCRCSSSPVDETDSPEMLAAGADEFDSDMSIEENVANLRESGLSWPGVAKIIDDHTTDDVFKLVDKSVDEKAYWNSVDKLDRMYRKLCKEREVSPVSVSRSGEVTRDGLKLDSKLADIAAKTEDELFPTLPRMDPQGYDEAYKFVNPGTGNAYRNNCHFVVQAMEMRARGYEVTAAQTLKDEGRFLTSISKDWMDPATGENRAFSVVMQDKGKDFVFKQGLLDRAADWPPGARGIVNVEWKAGAHVFSVYKDANGVLKFTDGQVSRKSVESYFNSAKNARIMRVDDLEPTARLNDAVSVGVQPVNKENQLQVALKLYTQLMQDVNSAFPWEKQSMWSHMYDLEDRAKGLGGAKKLQELRAAKLW